MPEHTTSIDISLSAGAVWNRVDLHLHSPGVRSFTCPAGADIRTERGREPIVSKYVEMLVHAQIAIGALTDYNGVRGEWFEPIRDLAAMKGISLLPGAELSFSYGKGFHLIVVFPANVSPGDINAAIRALDQSPGQPLFMEDGAHRDITGIYPVEAVQRLQSQFPCLVILPHPSESNGLCKLQPKDAAEILRAIAPDALEHCPDGEVQRLRSTGVLDVGFFERMAQVEFSDPKHLDEIGTKSLNDGSQRATWLKLSSYDLSAISLALRDPATRLAVGSAPQPLHARIVYMEVNGSGFLGKTRVGWNADLNVVIGGRGTGKSAVLETLRFALGLEPFSEAQFREDLVKHALASGGKVTVLVERPTGGTLRRYRIERVLGEYPCVYEAESGSPVDVTPAELFGPGSAPTIFGQREIYDVSGNEEYRLRLLDNLIGEEAQKRATAVKETLERLGENGRSFLDAGRKLAKREELLQRLKSIGHEIDIYEREGVAGKLRAATDLRSDGQQLKAASKAVVQGKSNLVEGRLQIEPALAHTVESLHKGRSSQKAILADAAKAISDLSAGMTRLWSEGEKLFDDAAVSLQLADSRWAQAVKPLDEELNRIKQELQMAAGALDPDRLLKLTEEKAALEPQLANLNRLETEQRVLESQRLEILVTLKQQRLEEHRLRRERADAITKELNGRLRLRVDFKGQKDDYRQRLTMALKGSSVTKDAMEKLASPEATDGTILSEAIRSGAGEVEKRFGITSGMAQRLVQWFTADETRLLDLEGTIPPDAVQVELRVDDEFRPLDRLSIGQRATAILLLLFALEGRILVLDQPEDDLDNRFVYEDIVTLLREQKGLRGGRERRQFIVATHNANIPVLGDAELVLALEAKEGRADVVGRSSIDDPATRRLIKTVMEGGEEAFRRRAEKYRGA